MDLCLRLLLDIILVFIEHHVNYTSVFLPFKGVVLILHSMTRNVYKCILCISVCSREEKLVTKITFTLKDQ